MKKKIIIKKNNIILFILTILTLIGLILSRFLISHIAYLEKWSNISLVVNIVILIIEILLNISQILKPKNIGTNYQMFAIIILFIIFLLINIFGSYYINKIISEKYLKITDNILKYCKINECSKYEIKKRNNCYDFVIINKYIDYDNTENSYEIHNIYDEEKIISIYTIIYSDKSSYSEELIKSTINNYFNYFNLNVNSQSIKKAFNNRFNKEKIRYDSLNYSVSEVYYKNKLIKIKTKIGY